MPNSQFFKVSSPISIRELASKTGCEVIGDENIMIKDIATLDNAKYGDISFLSNAVYNKDFKSTQASACIIEEKDIPLNDNNITLLISDNAYSTYSFVASLFYPLATNKATISDKATISNTAKIGKNVTIGDYCTIEDDVDIGDNCRVGPCTHIGQSVEIGSNTTIGNNVSLTYCIIGDNCIIHSGVRVGQDGFGFAISKMGIVKVPQLGIVRIGNNVEIGANTCIDRGAIEDTIIGDSTKLDNLIQIGHNVVIGKNCFLAGQAGISGSTKIGNNVMIGGQTGIAGHLSIGDNVKIAGKSGVIQNIDDGSTMGGVPAVNICDWHRQSIILKKMTKKWNKND